MDLNKKVSIAVWSLAAIVMIPVAVIIWAEQTDRIRHVCVDTGVVQTIDLVDYRTAYVTLEDGRSASFNQPSNLVPGKEVCLRSEMVYDF